MNSNKTPILSSDIAQYILATTYILVIATGINMGYYIAWESLVDVPIPDPVTLNWAMYQSIAFAILNGIIHYGFRATKHKNSFEYLKWLMVLAIANVVFCYVTMNIQMMPSINEIKRLYGSGGVPPILFGLSVPISLISVITGVWGIPYLIRLNGGRDKERAVTKRYQGIGLNLLRSYFIVVTIILSINLLYYTVYKAMGGKMPEQQFPISDLIQMSMVLPAIAAMMFLYLRDNAEKGLFMYIMLTVIIAISAFLAGVSRVDGQPVFDETLWLNIPLSLVSLAGELIGIPYFFKHATKRKQDKHHN